MVHQLYRALGRAIKQRRETIGMTQDALAHHVGLSRTSVTNIEGGRQAIYVHQLIAFGDALKISVTDFLTLPGVEISPPEGKKPPAEFLDLVGKLLAKSRTDLR